MNKPATKLAPAASTPDAVILQLNMLLADTYALAIKTHGAHWNVRGPSFFRLHDAFETQYQALFIAADDIAERIRSLGENAPGSIASLNALCSIGDSPPDDEQELVRNLREDHRRLADSCRNAFTVAIENEDEPSADLLIKRAQMHDKIAWMFSASLGE